METMVYRKAYRGNVICNGHNAAIFWVSRERENGRTVWRGGVTFGLCTDNVMSYRCFDSTSWKTTLQGAARASKTRDNAAVDMLHSIIFDNEQTVDELAQMNVYKDVYNDVMRNNGAWL